MERKGIRLSRIAFPGQSMKDPNKLSPLTTLRSSRKQPRAESPAHTRSVSRLAVEKSSPNYVAENTAYTKSLSTKHNTTHNQMREAFDLESRQINVSGMKGVPARGYSAVPAARAQEVRPTHGHGYITLAEAESFNGRNITILGVSISN